MTDTPRHGPCPCGSGRKYKNCCERKRVEELARHGAVRDALPRAADWLTTRYRREVGAALEEDYFGALDEDGMDALTELPPDISDMLEVNATEWLIAEGAIRVPGPEGPARRRALDLLLGPGGPLLTPQQRGYLEELGRSRLRPYEVLESRPGEGLLLRDLLDEAGGPVWVTERRGSRQLVQWDVIGARALRCADEIVLSGAIYPVADHERLDLVTAIRKAAAGTDATGSRLRRAQPEGHIVGLTIVDFWLHRLTAPPPEIQLRDAGTREPLMLVTDHYEVLDWDRLAQALESQPDVEGDQREGWTRFQTLEGDRRRSLLAVNIGRRRNRIEPFARTLRLADEGRVWLEGLAGAAIRHVSRDVVDPRSILQGKGRLRARESRGFSWRFTPAEATEAAQAVHDRAYHGWADQPVPALGDRTPREAVKDAEGRERVIALLKLYESAEHRRARQERREPADLRFLWEQVGLERPRSIGQLARL